MATAYRAGVIRRDYPPLAIAALAMVLLLTVLPSALNLPEANPSQTLEYAPVPPEDDPTNPPIGNLSSLGLGSASPFGSGLGSVETEKPTTGGAGGAGRNPTTKNCVGTPPRQTADPLAPPCVAFYDGDNGGATYPGVTRDEVRILFYLEGGGGYEGLTSRGFEATPTSEYFDLADPATDEEMFYVRQLRLWQRYFNDRYQTYNRYAHFFVFFSSGLTDAETRRAEAVENLQRVKPFAVQTSTVNPDPYIEVMARHGVMNFGSFANKPAEFFSRFPKLIWGYLPSIEQTADMFASWVCAQVVGRPVSFSGNPGDQGKPRRLGYLSTTDDDFPGMQLFAQVAKRKIEACGGEFVAEATMPYASYLQDTRGNPEAVQNVARFQQAGVTTVVWAQGFETNMSKAAGQANWRPEWVVAGDGFHEGTQTAQRQDKSVWDHAWVMTNVVRTGAVEETDCFKEQSQDPEHEYQDTNFDCSVLTFYQDLRQLFTGIQVAGPKLTPTTVDRGFHAIPAIRSDDPKVPACFYRPADYTCVKDAMVNWWDSQGQAPGQNTSEPGCWRMVEQGRRYFAGAWPRREASAGRTPGDPCNGYLGLFLVYVGP